MRFKIVGANSETGDDVDVVLEAPSQPDVEKLAHDKHILVSTIAPLPAGPPPQPAHAAAGQAAHPAHPPAHAPAANHATGAHAPAAHAPAHAPAAHAPGAPAGHGPAHAPAGHGPAGHATAAPGHVPTRAPTEDLPSISLVDDDPPPGNGNPAAPHAERAHGLITVNANSPSETAHTGAGSIDHGAHAEAPMEYHIILNQSLFLLESAVNRHLRDGWEPAGGLSVGMSNNALQFFQSMIRKKKGPKTE